MIAVHLSQFLIPRNLHQTATFLSLEQCSILLEEIVKERCGGNADELVKLVRENQIILRKMKVCSPCSFEWNKHEIYHD